MKKMMDWVGVAVVTLALLTAPACGSLDGKRSPQGEATNTHLEGQLEQAYAAGDEEAIAAIEAQLANNDAQEARGLVGGFVDLVNTVVPGTILAKPALLGLAPLLFKRPRKHFAKAAKDLNPFDGQMAPGEALKSIARAYGLKHSTDGSEKAADAEMAEPKDVPPAV